MHAEPTTAGMLWHTPAKLNLFLEVLGKREDGFHDIETLICPLRWFDSLKFQDDPSGQIELTCVWASGARRSADPGGEALPEGTDNLVVRAVRLVQERANVRRGARLTLIKRIPMASGLAGGSSDAASALRAASAGWGLAVSDSRLSAWGAELGSDVPFFLGRGAAMCRGRGERIERAPTTTAWHFVIAAPPAGLSTAAVYAGCRPAAEPLAAEELLAAWKHGAVRRVGRLMFNRLQAAARELSPWIGRLEKEFARLDVLGHQMSGSGTSYFGLCRDARHARRVAARLRARGVGRVVAVSSGA